MSATSRRWVAAQPVAVAAPLCLFADSLRHVVESRMLLHMFVEFPLLIASGWALASGLRLCTHRIDAHGLAGVTVSSAVAVFWMIPAALDASLLSSPVQGAKLLSWWLAGAFLGLSWPSLVDETKVFLFGNLAWMSATVGLLYQSTERRLCANYLFDDQQLTGSALVALSVVLGALAVRSMWRGSGRSEDSR